MHIQNFYSFYFLHSLLNMDNHGIWWENNSSFYCVAFMMIRNFSLDVSTSNHASGIWWIDYNVWWYGLPKFILPEIHWTPWICRFMCFINFRKYLSIILSISLSSHFPLSSLSWCTHSICVCLLDGFQNFWHSFIY